MSDWHVPLGTVVAVVLAACTSPVPSAPATTPAPAQGSLHLTTGADYNPHDPLTLRYTDADGVLVAAPDSIDAETTVSVDRALPVGRIRVLANDQLCDGPVGIQAGAEVDVVLAVSDGRCSITIVDTHAAGAVAHPGPRTALGVFVVPDSILVVRPLDPTNTIAPIQKPADERAEVMDFAVPPGRYELSVLVGGAVLATKEIDLKRGQEFWFTLRVVAATVPRVCGQIPRQQCETAITAAYERGLFPPPSSADLTSVRVRPSRFLPCYDAPAYDVFFDIRDEPEPIEATVATVGGDRLAVCTY